MLSEIKEGEDKGKLQIGIPNCDKCNRLMTGFFWKFYKNPTFTETEVGSSISFTDIWFQCVKCFATTKMPMSEVDKINALPLDMIIFPGGINDKYIRYTKLGNK